MSGDDLKKKKKSRKFEQEECVTNWVAFFSPLCLLMIVRFSSLQERIIVAVAPWKRRHFNVYFLSMVIMYTLPCPASPLKEEEPTA